MALLMHIYLPSTVAHDTIGKNSRECDMKDTKAKPSEVFNLAKSALENAKVFKGLPLQYVDELAGYARIETFDQKTCLLNHNETWGHLYFVAEGYVIARQRSASGDVSQMFPVMPGRWISFGSVMTKRPVDYELWAAAGSTLFAIPSEKVRDVAKAWSQLYIQIIEEINTLFLLAHHYIWNNMLLKAEKKTASHLILLANMYEQHDWEELTISQEQMSRSFGISRQTLSRHLQRLKKLGFLEINYGKVSIIDKRSMTEFCRI